ncbi:MAG: ABC transporter permease [Pseudomonadota bacterium]
MSFTTVLKKECLDNLRDRRTLLSSFSLAILGPIFFVGIMVFVLERALGESDDPTVFSVIGAQYAPALMAYLERENTKVTRLDPVDDPQTLVTSGQHDLVLIISPDYGDRYEKGNRNTLLLINDSSKLSSQRRHLSNLRGLISNYSRTIGLLRLQLRGVDPDLTRPITTQSVDVASPAARALTILASLPYFLVLAIFMGGFYLAIDTTAGEREHGSLEPLLTQPIPRAQLVLGKIAATSVFSTLSLLVFLTSLNFSIPFVPFERIGMSLEIGLGQLGSILLVCLPLIFFAAALLTVVASFAKSYKEAQTYLTIVIFIPTMPIIIAQFMNVETTNTIMLIPSLAQSTLMTDFIKGEPVANLHITLSMLATTLYATFLSYVAVWLYNRERILG